VADYSPADAIGFFEEDAEWTNVLVISERPDEVAALFA